VFFFASYRAGVTADATVLIDEKSVAHYKPFRSTNFAVVVKSFNPDSSKIQVGSIERQEKTSRLLHRQGNQEYEGCV
jgi:hypothetical protein